MNNRMIHFDKALEIVLSSATERDPEKIGLTACTGRILAEDILSDMDMPPFDKSAVDGYACKMADLPEKLSPSGGNSLVVLETIPAGKIPKQIIRAGQCSKVMTGAMIPAGADCVVMVEDVRAAGDGKTVVIPAMKAGRNICYRAEDIRMGDRILPTGSRITPAHVAVLASAGVTEPLVSALPRVGIIVTGDELVEPGFKPGPGKIRNSNASQLMAQVSAVPAVPYYFGIAGDNEEELHRILVRADEECDVVLLTGGVSMGDFDFVPAVMEKAGIRVHFRKVAVQPGKPTVFGQTPGGGFVFGLPGNPVSSFVIFEMMVKPFLLRMMRYQEPPAVMILPMGADFLRRSGDRKAMLPVRIRDGQAWPVEYHGSAHVNAYTAANGILIMEPGVLAIRKGETAYVRPI